MNEGKAPRQKQYTFTVFDSANDKWILFAVCLIAVLLLLL